MVFSGESWIFRCASRLNLKNHQVAVRNFKMISDFTGNPIKTILTLMAMWGKLGVNGRNYLFSVLVHGSKRLRAAATDFCGDRKALARREASCDGAGALAPFGIVGIVRSSRSAPAVIDIADGIGDAALGGRIGFVAWLGSAGASFIQAPVFLEGGALPDGQAREAGVAGGSMRRAVPGGGGRAHWRRISDRGMGAERMGEDLCCREGSVLRHRRQAGSLRGCDGRIPVPPGFPRTMRTGGVSGRVATGS